jgi:hypothetical protein
MTNKKRNLTGMVADDENNSASKAKREVLSLDDFSEADIAALEAVRAPDSSKAFDFEVSEQ